MKGSNLPSSWQWATIGELGAVISGGTPKTSEPANFEGNIPWITPADLTGYKSKLIASGKRNISKRGLAASSARIIPKRSVLFSSRAPIGYVAIAENDITTNQGFKSVSLHNELNEEYIYYYLKSAKSIAESQASGTTFKEISGSRFARLPVPIAPKLEQHRIVERIETLFARIDKGEEALRDAQKLIKRYRQSVLKAAVTGELTRDWREANRDKLEPASELLDRILEKRRAKRSGRGNHEEVAVPQLDELPRLPSGWCWASMDQLGEVLGGLTKNSKRQNMPTRLPMLRVANVYQGRLSLEDVHETGLTEKELTKVRLEPADLLIVEGNGSKEQIGRMAIWQNELPEAVHQNHLIKARLAEKKLAEFILDWFQSPIGRRVIEVVASSTSGLYTLSLSKVRALPVPLPSLKEAQEIARKIHQQQTQLDALSEVCVLELKRSAAMHQSILKTAFSGQLVPQDPNDEPASELLARIRAEREAAPKSRPRKKAARKKSARRKVGAGS